MKFAVVLFVFIISEGNFVYNRVISLENAYQNQSSDAIKIDLIPKIVGGSPAHLGDIPAQVSIQTTSGFHFCGGSLINLRHVLTAAHCLVNEGNVVSPNDIRIMGDDVHIVSNSETRQIRYPSHVFAHPGYNKEDVSNDIGVMRVSKAFTATKTFHEMPRSQKKPAVSTICTVFGWGSNKVHGTGSSYLQKVDVPVKSYTTCKNVYSHFMDYMICAGSRMKDSCTGDSGGPLICNNTITGVVSFGQDCGSTTYPGVYTDVNYFSNWIDSCLSFNGSNNEVPKPGFGENLHGKWRTFLIIISVLIQVVIAMYCGNIFFRRRSARGSF